MRRMKWNNTADILLLLKNEWNLKKHRKEAILVAIMYIFSESVMFSI